MGPRCLLSLLLVTPAAALMAHRFSQVVVRSFGKRSRSASIAMAIDEKPVRVRFAPSPTGSLHVGGARTALFNWMKVYN